MSENTHNTQDFRVFSLSIEFLTTLYGLFLVIWGFSISLISGSSSITSMIPAFIGVPLAFIGFLSMIKPTFRKALMHIAVVIGIFAFLGGLDFFRGMFTNYYAGLSKLMLLQRANLGRAWLMRSRNTVLKNPRELLILASILEKETGNDSEKQLISSVFHNRLSKGMKLQADPTVLYGVTMGKDVIARSPTKAEIKERSPYNTYIVKGLPIGPISNPSEASLFAAARPSKTEFLFFVSNGNGGHRFSKTYDGHKKGIEILLTRKREQKKSTRSGAMTYVTLPPAKPVLLK